MGVSEAIQALQARWGEVHISIRPGVATVSDMNPARRVWSTRGGAPKVYEQPTLVAALTVTLGAEGLGG